MSSLTRKSAAVRRLAFAAVAVSVVALAVPASMCAGLPEYEQEPVQYSSTDPDNVVTRLRARIAAGDAMFEYDDETGWLRSVLRALDVSESSQMLVFSKTSLQRHRIAPRRPRAIYFSDDVYIGYCQGGDVLEVSAVDPALGAVFYTVDQQTTERPRFTRQTDNCLLCHASSSHTGGRPGHVVRSLYVDAGGFPVLSAGTFRTDHTSPLEERWGGWYVTGTHGQQTHLGNLVVRDKRNVREVDNTEGQNVTDLSGRFDVSPYPTPHSDIVALMVFEHQTATHNQITRANFLTRRALWYEAALDRAFKEPTDEMRESTVRRIKNAGDPLVEHLLLCDEAELTGRIRGTSSFAREFAARGPRDSRGRSLRDLDLERRLFKYPCSYLIDSEAFDALPGAVRDYVLRRLWDVLTGRETDEKFAHLSAEDRRAILEILRETKPTLPAYWKPTRRR